MNLCLLGVILGRHYFLPSARNFFHQNPLESQKDMVLKAEISVLSPSEGFESAFLFAYGWRVVLFPKVVEETIKTLGTEEIS